MKSVILFGLPEEKDDEGSGAWIEDGVVQQALRALRDAVSRAAAAHRRLSLRVHVARPLRRRCTSGEVDNDASLELIARTAVSHVEAGADVVCPSDMMDGRVGAIREQLPQTPIIAYSAKYASAFYGPFRDVADSAPSFGDRRGYQMDPGNVREALRECEQDIAEGADMLMIKPALPYLDVIRAARDRFDLPLAAYNVSGEYAMVKAAAAAGDLDERAAALESLTAIRRAGADVVFTYWAKEFASWLSDASELWHRAQKLIPGGVNSPVRAMRGVGLDEPFFVARGEGAYLETADGRTLLDWVQSWGPLIFGHADPETVEAVREAALDGTTLRRADRARGRARRRDRRRGAVGRARPPRLVGHRGRDVGDPARARVHAPRPRAQVRRLLPRPRRPVPRERRLRARDARHPRVARRAVRRHGRHDRRATTTTSTASRRRSSAYGEGLAAIIVEPVAGNMGCVPPRRASSRRCACSATRPARCSSSTR